MANDRKKSSLNEYRALFPYFSKYKLRYAMGFLFLVVVDAAQVIIPQFLGKAIDIISSGNFRIYDVIVPAAIMTGLMAVISLGRFFWRYFIQGSARRIETELRKNLFEKLLSLSYDFYQKNKIGDLMARATNDLNAVRESIGMGLVALVDGTVMAAAILVIIFVQDTRTAAWAVLPLPLVTVLILLFGKLSGRRFLRVHEAFSAMSDAVQETFAGIRVIKSFVKEWWFIKKFADTNDSYRDANMELVKIYGIFFPLVTFLSGLTVLIVLLVGGIRVTEGLMSPGELVALFRYLQMLIWPLMGAGFVVNMIQRGAVCMGRINEVMLSVPAIRNSDKALKTRPIGVVHANETVGEVPREVSNGKQDPPLVELRRLSFSFSDGTKVLDDISFSIRKGTVTGILGRTGSGKSTLIKAITRMIDPPPGEVFIKGVESAAWDVASLRGFFAVTPQDSYLFSDSIRNNIAYGLDTHKEAINKDKDTVNKDAINEGIINKSIINKDTVNNNEADSTVDEILNRAASVAALEKDFPAFKAGWDTTIGERGLTLSGGQKQRTAIARSIATVLASGREILILDDSLSAVDAETEKAILDGLFQNNRLSDLTIIIISHRVSALSHSDEVVVLDNGRIIEKGTPAELAAQGGFYARMAALQSLGGDHEKVTLKAEQTGEDIDG